MKVDFYGHVRQYNNIKSEIDANLNTVIQSGQFVLGPMLKKFEGSVGFTEYFVMSGLLLFLGG